MLLLLLLLLSHGRHDVLKRYLYRTHAHTHTHTHGLLSSIPKLRTGLISTIYLVVSRRITFAINRRQRRRRFQCGSNRSDYSSFFDDGTTIRTVAGGREVYLCECIRGRTLGGAGARVCVCVCARARGERVHRSSGMFIAAAVAVSLPRTPRHRRRPP